MQNVGDERDRLAPNPWARSYQKQQFFERVGLIMALSFRYNFPLDLVLPTIFYKYLIGEELDFDDLKKLNFNICNSIESLQSMDPDQLEYTDSYFTTSLMDGTQIELVPGGATLLVT